MHFLIKQRLKMNISQHLTQIAIKALTDNKAQDIVEIDVSKLTPTFDAMVICTATSTRHATSLAKKIIEATKEAGIRPLGMEGEKFGEWVLIDLCDVIVHIMLQAQRELYHLEKLWMVTESAKNTKKIKIPEAVKRKRKK